MLLTAVELGLGALFFGIFTGEADLLGALGVPEGYRPIGALAVGHPLPGERSRPSLKTGRRPVEQVIHRGRWLG
jgi:nitroreductase